MLAPCADAHRGNQIMASPESETILTLSSKKARVNPNLLRKISHHAQNSAKKSVFPQIAPGWVRITVLFFPCAAAPSGCHLYISV